MWACTLDLDSEEDFNRLFNSGLMGVLHGLCGVMDIARGCNWLSTRCVSQAHNVERAIVVLSSSLWPLRSAASLWHGVASL